MWRTDITPGDACDVLDAVLSTCGDVTIERIRATGRTRIHVVDPTGRQHDVERGTFAAALGDLHKSLLAK